MGSIWTSLHIAKELLSLRRTCYQNQQISSKLPWRHTGALEVWRAIIYIEGWWLSLGYFDHTVGVGLPWTFHTCGLSHCYGKFDIPANIIAIGLWQEQVWAEKHNASVWCIEDEHWAPTEWCFGQEAAKNWGNERPHIRGKKEYAKLSSALLNRIQILEKNEQWMLGVSQLAIISHC